MKKKKSVQRLIVWVLMITMVMSTGINAWADEPKKLAEEVPAKVSERLGLVSDEIGAKNIEIGPKSDEIESKSKEIEPKTEGQEEKSIDETSETSEKSDKADDKAVTEPASVAKEQEEIKSTGVEKKQNRASTNYPLVDWITGSPELWVAQLDENGQPSNTFIQVDPTEYVFTKGETIKIYLKYQVPEEVKSILTAEDKLTYTVPVYIEGIKPFSGEGIKDTAYSDGDAGSYSIDALGNLEIKFNQEYLDAGKIKGGEFSFEGILGVNPDGNGKSTLEFGDAKVDIKVDLATKLNVKKEAELITQNYDGDSEIKYTIKVIAPALNSTNVTGAVVKDSFRTAGAAYVKDYTFDGYTSNGNIWTDGTGNKVTVDGKAFDWELSLMAPGEIRTLTYTVKVPKEVWRENGKDGIVNNNVINDVVLDIDGKQVDRDKADIAFSKHYIKKIYSHSDTSGNAIFKILVNWGKPSKDMDGSTVTDILSAGTLLGNVRVTRYTFSDTGKDILDPNWSDTITGVDGASLFSYTFNKGSDPDCRYGYVFQYAVKMDDGHVLNSVDLDGEYGMEVEYFGLGVVKNYIRHEKDENGKLWVDWSVKATSAVKAGFMLRDSLTGAGNTWHNWIDGFYQNLVPHSEVVTDSNGNILQVGIDYDVEYNYQPDGVNCHTINVIFKKDFPAGVTLKVKSCIDLDGLQKHLKKNGKTLNDGVNIDNIGFLLANKDTLVSDRNSFVYFEKYSLDKDLADDFYDAQAKTITWELTVNANGAMSGTVNIIEELPEGLELVSAEIINDKLGSLYDGVANPIPAMTKNIVSGSDNRTVELTLDHIKATTPAGMRDGQVVIKIVSRILDEEFDLKMGTTTFTNKATMVNNFTDREVLRAVTKDAEIVQESLVKTGVVDGSKIAYKIDVNKERKQLIPDSPQPDMQQVFFVDRWSENLSIDRESIKVYRVEEDGSRTLLTLEQNFQLEVDNIQREFKMFLEDKTYYQVEYQAIVSGAIGETVQIKNEVSFFGKFEYGTSEEQEFIIQKGNASSSSNPNITIKKYIQGTIETLAGAKFTLAPVTMENGNVKWEDQGNKIPAMGTPTEKQTNNSGKVVFSELEWDVLYVYQESGIPTGYEEVGQVKYHYVYLAQAAVPAYVKALQADGQDVRVNQESIELEVENARRPGEIMVKKVSATEKGDDNQPLELNGAEFILYKHVGNEKQYYAQVSGEIVWTTDIEEAEIFATVGNGTVTISGLGWGTYYVQEQKAPDGYIKDETAQEVTIDSAYVTSGTIIELIYENVKIEVKTRFGAQKRLTGRTLTADEFTFVAELVGGDAAKVEGLTAGKITAKNNTAGFVEFAQLNYTAPDCYVFEISETVGDAGGISYDETKYYVKVLVTDDATGALSEEVTYYKTYDPASGTLLDAITVIEFENSYTALGDIVFGATKRLTGRGFETTDQFTFELYNITGGTQVLLESKTINPGSGSSAVFAFDKINYTLADAGQSYTYKIVEKAGSASGITYDTTVYTGTYKITNNNQGKMVATRETGADLTDASNILFTNTYGSTGKITLTAKKEMASGANWNLQAGQFIFEVYEGNDVVATGDNNAAGEIIFTDIAYDLSEIGEHTYRVVEKETGETGVIFDQQAFEVKVQVSDNQDGTLKAQVTSASGSTVPITFVNDTTKVSILKVDEAGSAVADAGLSLYDAAGDLIESWTSTDTAHVLEATLEAGATYILKETKAPEGYLLAAEVTFTVNTDGEPTKVTMVDQRKLEEYSVKITKRVKFEGQNRAINYTFYAALFWDEACTQRASEVVALKLVNNHVTTAVIKGLAAGTYYVAETNKDGSLLDVSSDTAMVTNEISQSIIELTPQNETVKIEITNHLKNKEVASPEGEIRIQKRVVAGSKEKNVTETFYFTLYGDKEMKDIVATKGLSLKNQAKGQVAFKGLPFGRYYIAESDAKGIPVGKDYKYTVTTDQKYVTLQEGKEVITVNVKNDLGKGAPKAPEPNPRKKVMSGKSGYVKTGDSTQLGLYLLLLFVAGVVAAERIRGRKTNH